MRPRRHRPLPTRSSSSFITHSATSTSHSSQGCVPGDTAPCPREAGNSRVLSSHTARRARPTAEKGASPATPPPAHEKLTSVCLNTRLKRYGQKLWPTARSYGQTRPRRHRKPVSQNGAMATPQTVGIRTREAIQVPAVCLHRRHGHKVPGDTPPVGATRQQGRRDAPGPDMPSLLAGAREARREWQARADRRDSRPPARGSGRARS